MAKTLLQLTNEVGKNLRRSTGSTWTAIDTNADQIFIQQAINEAKRMVEDSWKWDVLNDTILFPTAASTREYDTSSLSVVTSDPTVTTERSAVLRDQKGRLQMWDITSGAEFRLNERTREYAEHYQRVQTTEIAIPGAVAIYQNGSGLTVQFVDTPSGARNYAMNCRIPQDDLTVAGTEIKVPWKLVVLAATALSAEERGEELGLDAKTWWDQYENAFGAAISQDSNEEDFQLQPPTTDYFNNGLSL
jgi:hypothetical protein